MPSVLEFRALASVGARSPRPTGAGRAPHAPRVGTWPYTRASLRPSSPGHAMLRFRFPIVIIDEDFRSENTSGLGIRALAQAIEKEGFEVLGATSYGDLSQFAQQQSRASAFILSIDDEEFKAGPEIDPAVLNLRKFIQEIRFKNAEIPIYLYGETRTSQHMPNDILRELHGFIHMFEDTPEFVARHIIREAKSYLDGAGAAVLPRAGRLRAGRLVFMALPGPLGRRGVPEEPGRPDVPPVLRREHAARRRLQLGRRARPAARPHRPGGGRARSNAARIFNADHCFFVTNGTSTSNKMVWHHTVAPGDVVVVDRNCHKSILHAIIMTGAVPVFLRADAQPLRHHRPDPAERVLARGDPQEDRRQPAAGRRRRDQGQAAHPDADAEHLRRRALQHRDHQARARRLHRHAALRRGLAAARRLPHVLRHASTRWASNRPRPKDAAGLRDPVARTSCWPASARPRRCWCRTRRTASSTATCSTRPT